MIPTHGSASEGVAGQVQDVRDERRKQPPLHGRLDVAAEGLLALGEKRVGAVPLERSSHVMPHQPQPRRKKGHAQGPGMPQ